MRQEPPPLHKRERRYAHGAARRAWLAVPLLTLPGFMAVQAGDEIKQSVAGLTECREIRADDQRLACYDRVTSGAAAFSGGDPPVKSPATENRDFGLERQLVETASITANVLGGFRGWSGGTRFELDNGQVWVQSGSGRYDYSGADRPITIRRGFMDGFVLQPEGRNRTVPVRRIK